MRLLPCACAVNLGTAPPKARRLGPIGADLRCSTVTTATPCNVPRVPASNLFERLFEFSPDAVLVTNLAGWIIITNAQAERLFGYDTRS
jgi:PAS domain-containing protein